MVNTGTARPADGDGLKEKGTVFVDDKVCCDSDKANFTFSVYGQKSRLISGSINAHKQWLVCELHGVDICVEIWT